MIAKIFKCLISYVIALAIIALVIVGVIKYTEAALVIGMLIAAIMVIVSLASAVRELL